MIRGTAPTPWRLRETYFGGRIKWDILVLDALSIPYFEANARLRCAMAPSVTNCATVAGTAAEMRNDTTKWAAKKATPMWVRNIVALMKEAEKDQLPPPTVADEDYRRKMPCDAMLLERHLVVGLFMDGYCMGMQKRAAEFILDFISNERLDRRPRRRATYE